MDESQNLENELVENELEAFSDLELLAELISRSKLAEAPPVTRRYGDHREALIVVGVNHCAHLVLSGEGLRALESGEAQAELDALEEDEGVVMDEESEESQTGETDVQGDVAGGEGTTGEGETAEGAGEAEAQGEEPDPETGSGTQPV